MSLPRILAVAAFGLVLLPSCKRPGEAGGVERGIASWYGHPYHGRKTANGEIYDMEQMTAAHRLLPFGSQVRVKDLTNNRTVEVRINDRGPFVEGRIIDLSHAAGQALDMVSRGTTKAELVVVRRAVTRDPDQYGVQVGTFGNEAEAERVRADMAQRFGSARVAVREGDPTPWRVIVGQEGSVTAAEDLAKRVQTGAGVFVVRIDPES